MLNLLAALDLRKHYTPRHYVAGATDKMSLRRAQTFEEEQVRVTGSWTALYTHVSLYSIFFDTRVTVLILGCCFLYAVEGWVL